MHQNYTNRIKTKSIQILSDHGKGRIRHPLNAALSTKSMKLEPRNYIKFNQQLAKIKTQSKKGEKIRADFLFDSNKNQSENSGGKTMRKTST